MNRSAAMEWLGLSVSLSLTKMKLFRAKKTIPTGERGAEVRRDPPIIYPWETWALDEAQPKESANEDADSVNLQEKAARSRFQRKPVQRKLRYHKGKPCRLPSDDNFSVDAPSDTESEAIFTRDAEFGVSTESPPE